MNINGMHVLSVVSYSNMPDIVFGVLFLAFTLVMLWLVVWAIRDGAWIGAIIFLLLGGFSAFSAHDAFTYHHPTQYKVTISDMSHFDYQHWKIVNQDGEILTVEKVNP